MTGRNSSGELERARGVSGDKKGHPQRGGFLVGATGFEPATSSSRTKRATKLRYAPTMGREECGFSASGQGEMRRFVACVRIMFMGEEAASALSYKDRRGNEKTWWSGYYMQRFPAIPGWRVLGKAMIQVRLICS